MAARNSAKKRTWMGRILSCLLLLPMGLCIYIIGAAAFGESMPEVFGYSYSVIVSGSMEDALHIGDVIWVKRQPFEAYQTGDIITYRQGGAYVAHRIVSMSGDTLVTKGDQNSAPDAPITQSQLKGKVIGIWPGVGQVLLTLRSPTALLLLIPLAIIVLQFGRITAWFRRRTASSASKEKS